MLLAKKHFPACCHNTVARQQGAVSLMQTKQVSVTLDPKRRGKKEIIHKGSVGSRHHLINESNAC